MKNHGKWLLLMVLCLVILGSPFGTTAQAATAGDEAYAKAFVERLYNICLGRSSDAENLEKWTKILVNQEQSAAQVVAGFVFSDEYQKKQTDDTVFVTMLYQVMLNRNPDKSGLSNWLELLSNGCTRKVVLAGFVSSTEFTKLCANYHVVRGTYTSDDVRDQNPQVTAFVYRLYHIALNREPDTAGFQDWISQLLAGKITGAKLAWSFFGSSEFTKKNVSNTEYVKILYQVFLNRTYDAKGLEDWVDVLDSGMSRLYVASGFSNSTEFQSLCTRYNITRGTLTSSESRDKNREMTTMVTNFYQYVLGRTPKASEINDWTEKLQSGEVSGLDLAVSFFFSTEYLNKKTTDKEFVTALYQCMLGRNPESKGLTYWMEKLDSGMTRKSLCAQIAESSEYTSKCKAMGVSLIANGWNAGVYYYEKGAKLSGWQTINNQTYYFDPEYGNAVTTGWAYLDGYKYYFDTEGVLQTDLESILGTQSSYVIKVNKTCNVVTVYAKDGNNGYIIPVKSFVCSTGEDTPLGTFQTPNKYRWWELMGPCWGQWCTRITGGVLFHSVYYSANGNNKTLSVSAYNKLGTTASHGCVRLTAGDAKWIYDNCSLGTTVIIYESSDPGPYGKPSAYTLLSSHTWDPTDPNAYYLCQLYGCH